MKKYIFVFLVIVCGAVANAGLVFTLDEGALGVSCDEPGFIQCTARIESELELIWSGFTAPHTYDYLPGVGLPWGGPPTVLDEGQGLFTAYTSDVRPAGGPVDIFSGIVLLGGKITLDPKIGYRRIYLIADTLNINGEITSGLMDIAYKVAPEPMTMLLLAVGGFAVLKRRSRA